MAEILNKFKILKIIVRFIKRNPVLSIAFLAAVVTGFAVPVDREYLGYFDFKTLTCLFCVLAVVCALRNINFFYILAEKVVKVFKNVRTCVLVLVYITFIGSMFIANDMALLTFLPLGYYVLNSTHKQKYLAVTFILQNIAANLGGMLTPFGNPQNLYLYSKYSIPDLEFIGIMAPTFALSVFMITLCCIIFIKPEPLSFLGSSVYLNRKKAVIFLGLFAVSIAIVFRGIPYYIGLLVIPFSLLFFDRKALKDVDYGLLLTFIFFFIFAGNMSRIDIIKDLISEYLNKNPLLFSILSCQVISNVPSSILLSQFTENYRSLLVGVNIGGTGTVIASLASLITFRRYKKHDPKGIGKYMLLFTAFNLCFLIILTVFALLTGN